MMNLDIKSVGQHLDRLERKGTITRRPGESRNIRLTGIGGTSSRGVPLVGRIAAGPAVFSEENLEDRVRMEDFFGPEGSFFLLRVQGDSMKGAGIRDGDLAAVEVEGNVKDKDIAVVVIDGEATVKRVFRRGRSLRLEPDNPDYETIVVDTGAQEVRVVGPVKGLIRRLD